MTGSLRLKRGRVTLDVSPSFASSGKYAVDAIILGPLAVTPSLDPAGGWRITHVAKGAKITDGLYGYFRHRCFAVAAMRELVAIEPAWDADSWTKGRMRTIKGAVGEAFRRMRAIEPLKVDRA